MKYTFLILLVLFSNCIRANNFECSVELKKYMEKILQVPEARNLISNIQKEGPLRIVIEGNNLSNQFGAFWEMDDRRIGVSLSFNATEGDIIGSILFELHNALNNQKLKYYDTLAENGMIDRESYVQSIEYIEFQNSHSAASIAKIGISMGIFPQDACLPTYKTFDEHYFYQKKGGHSAWIAKNYDHLTS